MKSVRLSLLRSLAPAFLVLGAASAQQPTAESFRAVTQKWADAVNAADNQATLDLYSPLLKKGLVDQNDTGAFAGLVTRFGKISEIGTPSASGTTARIPVTAERGKLLLTVTVDGDGLISGLTATPVAVEPAAPSSFAAMRLPVTGAWYVFWGGSTEAENFHVRSRAQQRAVDLLKTDQTGRTHKGLGLENSDYYAYGETVSSPVDGTVSAVVNGVPENTPGVPNSYNVLGNMVVIKATDNAYAVLGHLQPGSISVKPGDAVKAGQALGKVGNSGNVDQPYVHFHLQSGPAMQEAVGFEPAFSGVKLQRGGQTTTPDRYVPVRGDRIEPAAP